MARVGQRLPEMELRSRRGGEAAGEVRSRPGGPVSQVPGDRPGRKGADGGAESGLIEITEPSWPGPEEEEPDPDKEKSDPDPEKKDDEKSAPEKASGGEEEGGERWGTVEIRLPARVMEGDVIPVRAVLPPELEDRAAPSYRWISDYQKYYRHFTVLDSLPEGEDRTAVPEAEIQFLPTPDSRGKRRRAWGFSSIKSSLRTRERTSRGIPRRGVPGRGGASHGMFRHGVAGWEGGPTETGIVLKRKGRKDESPNPSGEFLLEIGTWPQRTLESVEKQVTENSPHWKKEAVTVDGYKGFMAVNGPKVVDMTVSSGVYEGYADLKGMVVKGQVSLTFQHGWCCWDREGNTRPRYS